MAKDAGCSHLQDSGSPQMEKMERGRLQEVASQGWYTEVVVESSRDHCCLE